MYMCIHVHVHICSIVGELEMTCPDQRIDVDRGFPSLLFFLHVYIVARLYIHAHVYNVCMYNVCTCMYNVCMYNVHVHCTYTCTL